MPSHPFNPDNILHALQNCKSQRHGAYLGICNHTDCNRNIKHGEPIAVHAFYSDCTGWHINALHCRDHNPNTTFDTTPDTNHSHTTAIITAIYNHPTTIPPRDHPILSDFRLITTTAEPPELEPSEQPTNNDNPTLEDVLVENSNTTGTQRTLDNWDTTTEETLDEPDER